MCVLRKIFVSLILFLLMSCSLCSCSNNKEEVVDIKIDDDCIVGSGYDLIQAKEPEPGDMIVTFYTSEGIIRAVLYPDKAPKAAENFIKHVQDGYYDGVKFHRIIPGFMIQSGDPTGTGYGGESIWGGKFETELPEGLYHFRGALAMARETELDTNGSQFYIVQNPSLDVSEISATGIVRSAYLDFGGYPFLDDMKYTIFGQVFQGLDVVDAIAAKGSASGTPSETVVIEKISITEYKLNITEYK